MREILMLVGLLLAFSIGLSGEFSAALRGLQAGLLAYLGATVSLLVTSFFLAAGVLVYRSGTVGLMWTDERTGATHGVTNGTRAKASLAAALFLVYGFLGIVALVSLAGLLNLRPGALYVQSIGLTVLAAWILASILLVVCGVSLSGFLHSLRAETNTLEYLGGTGFTAYAIVNLVSVLILAVPIIAIAANPLWATAAYLVALVIGSIMVFIAVPVLGIVIFSFMISHGLRLRRVRAGSPPESRVFAPDATRMPQYPPPIPIVYPQSLPVDSPTTAVARSPAAPSRTEDSWVLRLESQIADIERSIREQKNFLEQLDKGLVEGRIENETFREIQRNRLDQIAGLERELAKRKAQLSIEREETEPTDAPR